MSAFLTATPLITSKRAPTLAVDYLQSSRRLNHVLPQKRATVLRMELDLENDIDNHDGEVGGLGYEDRKLFVGNLAWDTTEDSLTEAFAAHGTVIEARVVCNRDTGKSRGFGFVEYDEAASATQALEMMNGVKVDGREVRVDRANRRPDRRQRDNYY